MTYDESCRLLAPTLEFLETLRKRAEPRTYTDAEIALKKERLAEIQAVQDNIAAVINELSGNDDA